LGRAGRSWNGPERTGEAGDAEAATAAVRVDSMVASSSRGGRGDGSGAAVAVATGVVLLPLRSELAVWRGGMEQGDAGGEGYKKGKPGASAAAARRGAVLRSCACAAHAHVGGTRSGAGGQAGGTAARSAVCGGC
jgi:hypothetical protein